MSSSYTASIIDNLLHITGWKCLFFFKTKNLDFVVFIFQNLEFLFVIKQVHTLATIDLEVWHEELDIVVSLGNLEYVIDCILGNAAHCESLSWTGLSIGEASYYTILE